MDQTQAFLARVLPWDIHPTAYRNIHHDRIKEDGTKGDMPGGGAQVVDEALALVNKYDDGKKNVYVCMSLQAQAHDKFVVNARGRSIPGAKRNNPNTIGCKNFFLDIDVKDKGYASTAEALTAFSKFKAAFGLPGVTTITASGGGGVHVIWVTDTLLAPDQWKIIAEALKKATQQYGLLCDHNVTSDITRVLRVPGTFNCKYNPPRLCTTLGRIDPIDVPIANFRAALSAFVQSNVVQGNFGGGALAPKAPLPKDSEFSSGVTLQGKLQKMSDLQAACPLVADTLLNHGVHHTGNGIWHNMILLSTFIEDGLKWAHEFSSGHHEYDPVKTAAKYQEKLDAKSLSGARIGWPSCATLYNGYPTGPCASCDKLSLGKSPLHYATAKTIDALALPDGYSQSTSGVWLAIQTGEKNENGADKVSNFKITGYHFDDPWLSLSYEGAMQLNFNFIKDAQPPRQGSLQADKTQQPNVLQPYMARQQFNLGPDETKGFSRFMMSWMQKLEEAGSPVHAAPSLGWAGEDATPEGFVYNGVMHMLNGTGRAPRLDATMLAPWMPRGELAKWHSAAQFIVNQKRPGLEAIIAAAFAGPLVKFTGHKGLLVSAYSPETGIGKTTAMGIAAAVWGHPVESSQALDDTNYSALKRLGAIKSLTLFWDEVRAQGQDKSDRLANFIFALTTGRERTRMSSNLTMQPVGRWQTMLVTASNQSVLEIVRSATAATDAGGVRVFEWRVLPSTTMSGITSSEVSRIADAATSNFGQAGLVYAQWLGKNTKLAADMIAKASDMLNNRYSADPDERFWISSMACMLIGAKIAKDLGLVDFDMKALSTFFGDTLQDLRNDRLNSRTLGADTPNKIVEMIGTYLSECRYDRTLETATVPNVQPTQVKPGYGNDRLRTLDVHIDTTAAQVHLRAGPFIAWLYEHGLQKVSVFAGLRSSVGAYEQRIVMGAHTVHSVRTKVSVLTIPLSAIERLMP